MNEISIKNFVESELKKHLSFLYMLRDKAADVIKNQSVTPDDIVNLSNDAVSTGMKELNFFKLVIDRYILNCISGSLRNKNYSKTISDIKEIRKIIKRVILNYEYFDDDVTAKLLVYNLHLY